MKKTFKRLNKLFAVLLTVSMIITLPLTAFAAAENADLHIRSLGDIPTGGSYETIYIEESVGAEEIVLSGITAKKIVVSGGKGITLDAGCKVDDVSVQHTGEAVTLTIETGAQVSTLVIESAENDVTCHGKIGTVELKADNVTVSMDKGAVEQAIVTGDRATLIIESDAIAAECTVDNSTDSSRIVVRGSVVSANVLGENSAVTVEKGGSVATISASESAKGAEVSVSGTVGHIIVREGSSDVKIDIADSGKVVAVGAEANVEINMSEKAKLDNLITTEKVTVSGNPEATRTEVKDTAISGNIVNIAPTAPAEPEAPNEAEKPQEAETPAQPQKKPMPAGTQAEIDGEYYKNLQSALNDKGNVKLHTDLYCGNVEVYDPDGHPMLAVSEVTDDNKDSLYVDVWYAWNMEGMKDKDGNECPRYLPLDDKTLYRDTAVSEGDKLDWVSAKDIYEHFKKSNASKKIMADTTTAGGTKTLPDQYIAEKSQAIDMNGHTLYKVDGNGNGLRLGQTYLDNAVGGQTFYVENGGFVAEQKTYESETDTWTDGEPIFSSGNTLYMRDSSTYIIKDSSFQNGYVHLNFDGKTYDASKDPITKVCFDNCKFDTTKIKVTGGSHSNQTDGYKFELDFSNCSFIIGKDGQIYLDYYVWGDVNFSNCDFTVTDGKYAAVDVDAYAGSNGDHDLTITFEESKLNGKEIDNTTNLKELVDNSHEGGTSDVTTVFVAPEGIETAEKVMDHTDTNETKESADEIKPESAESNVIAAEHEAEKILGVDIVDDTVAASPASSPEPVNTAPANTTPANTESANTEQTNPAPVNTADAEPAA